MKSDNLLLAKRIENFRRALPNANLRFPRALIYEMIEFKPPGLRSGDPLKH